MLPDRDFQYLDVEYLKFKHPYDKNENLSKIRVTPNLKSDTTNLSILAPSKDYIHKVDVDSIIPLKIILSNLIFSKFDTNSIILKKDSVNIPFSVYQDFPLAINLVPKINWEENSVYNLNIINSFIKPDEKIFSWHI